MNQEQRDRMLKLARWLGPWFDRRSYRPILLLLLVSFTIFLGPLAVDLFKAWYFSLPNSLRRALGQGTLMTLIAAGLYRLWLIRPADSWPVSEPLNVPAPAVADRLVPWLMRLAVASLVIPLTHSPDGLGFADWDFYLEYYEALRQTVVHWGQFPWWNPWCRGGFPLASHPQISAVSIASPLVLIFGTTPGLGLATAVCLFLAVEGAYRLAHRWLKDPWGAAAAALVYGLNGGVIVHSAQGYDLAMSYWSLPWLAYAAGRLGERFGYGLLLGTGLALAVLNGINYLTLYGGVLAGLVWIRQVRVQPAGQRLTLFINTLAAAGACLLLCGWRLATVLPVLACDQRERITTWDETPLSILHYLLARPPANWYEVIPGQHHADFVSLTSYVGPVVVVLGVLSLAQGWRWWHTLTACCAWLAIGSLQWYQPSYWLQSWPLIGSAHVVTRWRYVALLGLGLAAGSVLARWRGSANAALRGCAALLVVVIGADLVSLAHVQLRLAFSVRPTTALFPGPPVPTIVNVRQAYGYPAGRRRYGVIEGYEPMLGYRRNAPSVRRARGCGLPGRSVER